jgi:hypothetical protein
MKKFFLTLLSITFLSVAILHAQTHFTAGLAIAVPAGEFRENTDATGVGFNAGFYVPFAPKVPVFFGLNFNYAVLGRNDQLINENIEVKAGNTILSTIPISLRSITNNNVITTHAVLRAKAPLPFVQPYVEGLVGFNYLWTRTKITDETPNRILTGGNSSTNNESNVINAKTQSSSFALSYGVGGGVMIKKGQIGLDLRVDYILGNRAEYYEKSQIQTWDVQFSGPQGSFDPNNPTNLEVSNPDVTAIPKESKTDLFIGTMGLVVSF